MHSGIKEPPDVWGDGFSSRWPVCQEVPGSREEDWLKVVKTNLPCAYKVWVYKIQPSWDTFLQLAWGGWKFGSGREIIVRDGEGVLRSYLSWKNLASAWCVSNPKIWGLAGNEWINFHLLGNCPQEVLLNYILGSF